MFHHRTRTIGAFLCALSCLGAFPASDVFADLIAGMAEVEITPPVGYRMSGYFVERVSTGTHDPLKAKALYLAQRDTRVALVVCDLIGVPRNVSQRARALVAEKTGIAVSNIAVTATHTHTGPLYFGAMRDYLHAAAVERHGRDPSETVDLPSLLAERIAEAVVKAVAAAGPARLASAFAPQDPPISFNRRFLLKDGSVRMNPGASARPDEIIRPVGPIDPEVTWLLVQSADGKRSVGGMTVFAMHLDTTGGLEFSADYPYYIEGAMQKRFGTHFISLFGLGTCGDVNHLGRRTGKESPKAPQLGEALSKTLEAMGSQVRSMDEPSLAVRGESVRLPLQRFSPEQIAQAARDVPKIGRGELPFLEEVRAYKITDLQSYPAEFLPVDVQAIRLDRDTAIVLLPGEIFADTGLAIKRDSPFKHTLVIELANDNPAYIPTRKAFEEGGYETVNSRVQPGAAEMLAEAAVGLLKQLESE